MHRNHADADTDCNGLYGYYGVIDIIVKTIVVVAVAVALAVGRSFSRHYEYVSLSVISHIYQAICDPHGP